MTKPIGKRKTTLVINYRDCPEHVRNFLKQREQFGNDRYLAHISDLMPMGERETWATTCTMENIEQYRKDQEFDGSIEDFIEEYYLVIDKWLIDSKVDLTGVDLILFKICW